MARNKRPVEDKPVSESSDSEQQNNSDQESEYDTTNLNNSVKEDHTDKANSKPKSEWKDGKRAVEAELGWKEVKKIKVEDENVKKSSKLFSEDDEIVLLEGVVGFQAKKGIDVFSDIPKFYEFIKRSNDVDVAPNELKEKVRRLKNKFISNVYKGVVFSKSNDLKVFNLSKKLWGSSIAHNVVAEKAKKSAKTKDSDGGGGITLGLACRGKEGVVAKNVANTKKKGNNGGDNAMAAEEYRMADAEEDYSVKYPLCVGGLMEEEGLYEKSRAFSLRNLGLIGKAKLEQYEAKLEKIKWAELELFIQKKELINEKLRVLLDSSKSGP